MKEKGRNEVYRLLKHDKDLHYLLSEGLVGTRIYLWLASWKAETTLSMNCFDEAVIYFCCFYVCIQLISELPDPPDSINSIG